MPAAGRYPGGRPRCPSSRPMLRTVSLAALILTLAVGGGALSVYWALGAREGVGAVAIGPWVSFPDLGTPGADPYSKARIARQGLLSLGLAEGLTFAADRDSDGRALSRDCRYEIEGIFPPARFWTLYAADASHRMLPPQGLPRRPALNSLEALRRQDNSLSIAVARQATPGNWLAVPGNGPMVLVLTLYDTPSASSAGIADLALPAIREIGCDA